MPCATSWRGPHEPTERLGTLLGYLDYLNERVPAFLDQLRTLEANGATWLQPGEPVTPKNGATHCP